MLYYVPLCSRDTFYAVIQIDQAFCTMSFLSDATKDKSLKGMKLSFALVLATTFIMNINTMPENLTIMPRCFSNVSL